MTKANPGMEITHRRIRLYVDKISSRWIVSDGEGGYWMLASNENAWEDRQALSSTEHLQLEPVPGHYKHMLGIPG